MQAVVEWGTPKSQTKRRICDISTELVLSSAGKARELAAKLLFIHGQGHYEGVVDSTFAVCRKTPRRVFWTPDGTFWVAVSLLDGVPRGPYAGSSEFKAASPKPAVPDPEQKLVLVCSSAPNT